MAKKRLLGSIVFIIILAASLGFLGSLKYRQWKNQRKIEQEKQDLVKQAEDLEQKNSELKQSLSYLNSENFKERIIRQQLNMQKPGELVYNFTDPKTPPAAEIKPARVDIQSKTNPEKWWVYFFGNN